MEIHICRSMMPDRGPYLQCMTGMIDVIFQSLPMCVNTAAQICQPLREGCGRWLDNCIVDMFPSLQAGLDAIAFGHQLLKSY